MSSGNHAPSGALHQPEILGTRVNTISWNPEGSFLAVSFDQETLNPVPETMLYTQVFQVKDSRDLTLALNYHARHIFWLHENSVLQMLLVSDFGGIRRYSLADQTLNAEIDEMGERIWFGIAGSAVMEAAGRLINVMTPLRTGQDAQNFQTAYSYRTDTLDLTEVFELPFSTQGNNNLSWIGSQPGGALLASSHWDGRLRIWQGLQNAPIFTVDASPGQRLLAGAWSPDGRFLAVGGVSGELVIFNASTGEIAQRIMTSGEIDRLAWHPDSRQLYASGVIWDMLTHESLEQTPLIGGLGSGIAWSPRGEFMLGRHITEGLGTLSLTDSILDAGGVVIVSQRDPLGR